MVMRFICDANTPHIFINISCITHDMYTIYDIDRRAMVVCVLCYYILYIEFTYIFFIVQNDVY